MENAVHILVVDDEKSVRESLARVLQREGFVVHLASSAAGAETVLDEQDIALVVTDMLMPDADGITLLRRIKKRDIAPEVIVVTGYATVERAVDAMREGAYDFVTKPLKRVDIVNRVYRALERQQLASENRRLHAELATSSSNRTTLIGESPALKRVITMVDRVAPSDSTVLITGESGTGKEIVARLIHKRSRRASGPFVPVNCGAIAENIIESELFGHVRGAFTGAVRDRDGLFRIASGGTIFLDEVCVIPPNVQVKLLRALEEREVRPVGAPRAVGVDVRVVAACNGNIQKDVEEGRFRSDLYYRLNVVGLNIPPLRERREDLSLLVDYFVGEFNRQLNKKVDGVSDDVTKVLMAGEWKGNVREVKNTIEHAMILCDGPTIRREHLPLRYVTPKGSNAIQADLKTSLQDFERKHITQMLSVAEGDKKAAAEMLGVSLSSLYRKLTELGIASE